MINWIKSLFCKHDYKHESNIHGDFIVYTGYKRSIWKCTKCNKYKYSNSLNKLD